MIWRAGGARGRFGSRVAVSVSLSFLLPKSVNGALILEHAHIRIMAMVTWRNLGVQATVIVEGHLQVCIGSGELWKLWSGGTWFECSCGNLHIANKAST